MAKNLNISDEELVDFVMENRKAIDDSLEGVFFPVDEIVDAVRKVLLEGAKKYEPNGWMQGVKFDPKSNVASINRHIMSDALGQHRDPETGLLHLEHAGCRIAMALYMRRHNLATFKFEDPSVFDEQNI